MPEPVTAPLLVLGARSLSPLARAGTDGAARRRRRLPRLPRSASLSQGPPARREKPHRRSLRGLHPSLPAAGTSPRPPRRGATAATLRQTRRSPPAAPRGGFRARVHGRAGGETDGRTDGCTHTPPPQHTWASPRPTQPLPRHGTHRVAQRRLLAEHRVPHGRGGAEGTLPPHGAAAAAATLGAALPSGAPAQQPAAPRPRRPSSPLLPVARPWLSPPRRGSQQPLGGAGRPRESERLGWRGGGFSPPAQRR